MMTTSDHDAPALRREANRIHTREAEVIRAATAPVVAALPQGPARAPYGCEPANLLVVLRTARR